MSKDKAIQYTQKIYNDLQKLAETPHEIEIDSLLGYVRILYSTLKEMEVTAHPDNGAKSLPDTFIVSNEVNTTVSNPPKSTEDEKPDENTLNVPQTEAEKSIVSDPVVKEVNIETVMPEVSPDELGAEETMTDDLIESENVNSNSIHNVSEVTVPAPLHPQDDFTELKHEADSILDDENETVIEQPEVLPIQPEDQITEKLIPTIRPTNVNSAAIDELFKDHGPTGLVDFLGLSPIDDIRKAWGLNDKMLIVKELFNNDNQVFEDTLSMLNKFTSFIEAKTYLTDHIIPRYDWNDVAKFKRASNFIMNAKRLYI